MAVAQPLGLLKGSPSPLGMLIPVGSGAGSGPWGSAAALSAARWKIHNMREWLWWLVQGTKHSSCDFNIPAQGLIKETTLYSSNSLSRADVVWCFPEQKQHCSFPVLDSCVILCPHFCCVALSCKQLSCGARGQGVCKSYCRFVSAAWSSPGHLWAAFLRTLGRGEVSWGRGFSSWAASCRALGLLQFLLCLLPAQSCFIPVKPCVGCQ